MQTLRIPRGQGLLTGLLTADSIPAYKAQALELAKQFRAEGIDILVYGCTAASFLAGAGVRAVASTSADFGRRVDNEARTWNGVIARAGVKPRCRLAVSGKM